VSLFFLFYTKRPTHTTKETDTNNNRDPHTQQRDLQTLHKRPPHDPHTTKETYKHYKRDLTGPLTLLVRVIVDFQSLFFLFYKKRPTHTTQESNILL